MLKEKGYFGCPDVLSDVGWLGAPMDDKKDVLYTANLAETLYCSVVGDIPLSLRDGELSIKGEFDPNVVLGHSSFANACMPIRLVCPRSVVYAEDYKIMLSNFKILLDVRCPSGLPNPFLDNGDFVFRHKLFDTMVRTDFMLTTLVALLIYIFSLLVLGRAHGN